MDLIEKSALVAEIEARIKGIEVSQKAGMIKRRDADKKILLFKSVLSLIDSLEVKEVDLDEEIEKCMKRHHMLAVGRKDFTEIAYHFFILGKKQAEEQMTKDAIDAVVHIDAGNYPYIPEIELYDYDKDIPLAKNGDKYNVVLIKEDNYE